MTRLSILHIDTERGWRGGQRQALWLASELARRGHRSTIVARPDEPLARRAREAGLEVIPLVPRNEWDPVAAWKLHRVIVRDRFDLVHAHAAHALTLSALATGSTTVPLIAARRVDFPLRTGRLSAWKYERAAAVIAVSTAAGRVLARSIAADRIAVVPDGVDLARRVTPASSDTLAALGVPPGAPLVVQVAQLVGHKDPVNLVRAMAVVRAVVPVAHALMVGDGPLRDDVESAARELGLESTVHLAGYRTDADALLAAADVAVLGSSQEGLGSVLLDAMAFGRPIVATTAGGIPEIVEHDLSGLLVPPRDPESFGASIARLLGDAPLRERLGAGARQAVGGFSIERMTDRTMEIYERVLAGAGRRMSISDSEIDAP